MPFINTKTNVTISASQRETMKSRLGSDIQDIGKTESWLMLGFEDEVPMYFKGSDAPCAMVEVSLFGKASAQAYDTFTGHITNIVNEELGVAPDRIYVKYAETPYWGWNGRNL